MYDCHSKDVSITLLESVWLQYHCHDCASAAVTVRPALSVQPPCHKCLARNQAHSTAAARSSPQSSILILITALLAGLSMRLHQAADYTQADGYTLHAYLHAKIHQLLKPRKMLLSPAACGG